jgi:hypothetical protein
MALFFDMIRRIEKVTLLKDMPGKKAGSEIKIHNSSIKTGEGTCLRGANVGSKFYYEGEFKDYLDFFEIKYIDGKP